YTDGALHAHHFSVICSKHSFNDDQGISIVNAATYLKMNIDLLRNAMDHDLFSVAPRLDEIENL
ncbi:hypothetical protein, partial [Holdemanella biformis]